MGRKPLPEDVLIEHKKEWQRRYREKNKEKILAYHRLHRETNPEYHKERNKHYRLNNLAYCAFVASKHRVQKRQRIPTWDIELTNFVLEEAHILRRIRTDLFGFCWHVDHIIPLRGKLVSGLHVWNNIRVIPAKENQKKGNRHDPD